MANVEDKVNRLTARNKYRLDQSTVEVARHELSTVIADARNLMGLPPQEIEATAPHLLNRWAEAADVPEPEPANPDDLR